MPALDIFNNDAFGVAALTKAINEQPYVPGRLGQLGLFSEEGVTTTSVMIEKVGETLALVPAGERGAPATPVGGDKRLLVAFNAIHLPDRATILADEVQNVRAFGSESELDTVQAVVDKRLAKMRRRLDATIEFQRMGALKGQIVDADGSTVLENLFTKFGVSQQVHDMDLGGGSTNTRVNALGAKRKVEDALGAATYDDLRAFCSADFFDELLKDDDVLKAYERWQDGEFLRNDPRGGFRFAGIIWEEYRGTVGGVPFIAAGDALLVPQGVPDLFVTHFAPADYMETANTIGLPYYAKQEELRMNKGVDLESQSNPISICTRPRAVVRLTAT